MGKLFEEKRKQIAQDFYNNKKVGDHLVYLYGRWQDEKEYEDINDYSVNLKKFVEEIGGKFHKMTKRPFGFQYILAGATYHISVIYASNRYLSYQYKRIA